MDLVICIGRMRRDRGISCARPSALGNPFVIGRDGTREEVVGKFGVWFPGALAHDPAVRSAFARILKRARCGDVTLLCWCGERRPCHVEVIKAEVERRIAP